MTEKKKPAKKQAAKKSAAKKPVAKKTAAKKTAAKKTAAKKETPRKRPAAKTTIVTKSATSATPSDIQAKIEATMPVVEENTVIYANNVKPPLRKKMLNWFKK